MNKENKTDLKLNNAAPGVGLNELSLIELKALAFDCMSRMQHEQIVLNQLNDLIIQRTNDLNNKTA